MALVDSTLIARHDGAKSVMFIPQRVKNNRKNRSHTHTHTQVLVLSTSAAGPILQLRIESGPHGQQFSYEEVVVALETQRFGSFRRLV